MYNLMTYNRLINILSFIVIIPDWQNHTIDYLSEKYFRIFSKLPDKDVRFNEDFTYDIYQYCDKWKCSLSKDEELILHTYYMFHNINVNPKNIIKIYSKLFTSFNYINNSILNGYLHSVLYNKILIQWVNLYKKDLLKYKRLDKILKLNNKFNE